MVAATATLGSANATALDGAQAAAGKGTVRVNVDRIARILWIAAAIVLGLGILREVVLHIIGTGTVLKDLRHFALDAEHSLPTWFESLSMATAAGLLTILAALSHRHDPVNRWHWTLLAFVFILMSMDEAVAIYEATMAPLRDWLKLSGFLYFSWVILAAPILIALAIFYIPFMFRLPWRTALRFAIAGAMFVGGAFGLEFVGGYFVSAGGFESLPIQDRRHLRGDARDHRYGAVRDHAHATPRRNRAGDAGRVRTLTTAFAAHREALAPQAPCRRLWAVADWP